MAQMLNTYSLISVGLKFIYNHMVNLITDKKAISA